MKVVLLYIPIRRRSCDSGQMRQLPSGTIGNTRQNHFVARYEPSRRTSEQPWKRVPMPLKVDMECGLR